MREQLSSLTRTGPAGGGARAGGGANNRSVSAGRGEGEPSPPGGNAELARALLVQHSQWLKSFAQQLGNEEAKIMHG